MSHLKKPFHRRMLDNFEMTELLHAHFIRVILMIERNYTTS